jgi:hypothetical protein
LDLKINETRFITLIGRDHPLIMFTAAAQRGRRRETGLLHDGGHLPPVVWPPSLRAAEAGVTKEVRAPGPTAARPVPAARRPGRDGRDLPWRVANSANEA